MINLKTKKIYNANQVFNSFNLGIQLSYFRNKSQRLELEKMEMANEILKLRVMFREKGEQVERLLKLLEKGESK